ncbi:sulfotransferase [Caenimonas sp. SL110]|uniref:sulfotransferase n=1 Tax=Caenimonas sp. SL110 TaxID=1450524 RepID=UPI000654327E|nr:sulfotransferase [Caenimonas sp. SL110]
MDTTARGNPVAPAGAALPYVFVIGFNKTGTTSIDGFFRANGFPSIHWGNNRLAAHMFANCLQGRRALEGYDQSFRVFSDMVYRTRRAWFEGNSLFRTIDADYPGSYFLYNTRPMEDWLASREKHRGAMVGESLLGFYLRYLKTQDIQVVRDHWRRTREHFEQEIRAYFSGNPRFMEISIDDEDFASKVSSFIGVPLDGAHWVARNVTPGWLRAPAASVTDR